MTINLKTAFRATDAFIEDAEPDTDLRYATLRSVSTEDFSFQNSFDSLKGQTESLSVSGVTGSIDTIDKAVSGRDPDDKKDDNGIGWDDVMEAQDRIRAEIEQIRLANGRFEIFGMSIAEEDMDAAVADTANNFDKFSAEHSLQGEAKDSFQHWLLYYQGLPEGSPEKALALQEMARIDHDAAQDIAVKANDRRTARPASQISQQEANNADITQIADDADYERATSQLVDRADRAELAVQIRNGTSMAGSSDLAASFEAGFSASPAFNAAAAGGDSQQLAMAEPAPSAQNLSGPAVL